MTDDFISRFTSTYTVSAYLYRRGEGTEKGENTYITGFEEVHSRDVRTAIVDVQYSTTYWCILILISAPTQRQGKLIQSIISKGHCTNALT